MITFIAIYLGIVFLIAGAALLALKELSESTVNKERYAILDKIGVDEKQKHQALLWQMGIFFGLPMLLAMIHAVFGILYASNLLKENVLFLDFYCLCCLWERWDAGTGRLDQKLLKSFLIQGTEKLFFRERI